MSEHDLQRARADQARRDRERAAQEAHDQNPQVCKGKRRKRSGGPWRLFELLKIGSRPGR